MSPEVKALLDQLRWLAETDSHPYIRVLVEGSAGDKGFISIDRRVLAELIDAYPYRTRRAGTQAPEETTP